MLTTSNIFLKYSFTLLSMNSSIKMRIEGAPRHHISNTTTNSPAFLVLSSHAYSALGRFLISKRNTLVAFRNFVYLFIVSSFKAASLLVFAVLYT